jgi:hypothetical protein
MSASVHPAFTPCLSVIQAIAKSDLSAVQARSYGGLVYISPEAAREARARDDAALRRQICDQSAKTASGLWA